MKGRAFAWLLEAAEEEADGFRKKQDEAEAEAQREERKAANKAAKQDTKQV